MSDVELDDLNMVFITEKKLFIFWGIYPMLTYTVFYYIRTIILFFLSTTLALSMLTVLVMGANDMSQVTDILFILMTYTVYLWKVIIFIAGKRKILAIEDHLRQPVFYKYLRNYGADFLKVDVYFLSLIAYVYRLSILVGAVFFGIMPLIDNNPEKNLPFPGWFPFDKDKYRAPIYVLQMACQVVSATTNISIDILTLKMIIIAVVMLKTLKRCLSEIDYTDGEGSDIVSSDLRVIVILHEHILQYVTMIEDMFSYGLFIIILASIAVTCVTGFQMMVVPVRSAQFLMLTTFFFSVMFQVVIFCWYGNKILSEADGITNACYMSNWYEGTMKAKKTLFMIMEKSKREVNFTAGKTITLSLPTLLLIVKSSYSFFTVLKQFYNKA